MKRVAYDAWDACWRIQEKLSSNTCWESLLWLRFVSRAAAEEYLERLLVADEERR